MASDSKVARISEIIGRTTELMTALDARDPARSRLHLRMLGELAPHCSRYPDLCIAVAQVIVDHLNQLAQERELVQNGDSAGLIPDDSFREAMQVAIHTLAKLKPAEVLMTGAWSGLNLSFEAETGLRLQACLVTGTKFGQAAILEFGDLRGSSNADFQSANFDRLGKAEANQGWETLNPLCLPDQIQKVEEVSRTTGTGATGKVIRTVVAPRPAVTVRSNPPPHILP